MNDILDRLESLNPYPAHSPIDPPTSTADQLFASITAATGAETRAPTDLRAPRRPQVSMRRRVGLTAAMLASLVLLLGFLFAGPGTSSAQAALTKAAQAAAGFESGRADVVVDRSGLPTESGIERVESTYRYQGNDYVYVETGTPADGDEYRIETRRIGDQVYFASALNEGKFFAGTTNSGTREDMRFIESLESTYALDPTALGTEAVTQILNIATNVEQGPLGLSEIYTATLSPQNLARLTRSEVPPGLALLVESSDLSSGEAVYLQADVVEGVLTQFTIRVGGDVEQPLAVITTSFLELGEPQVIQAPPAERVLDLSADLPDNVIEIPTPEQEIEEQLAVLEDLGERRPRLCIELLGSMADGRVEPDEMRRLIVEQRALAECYRVGNEPEAAAIIDSMADAWQRALNEEVALADVEARRPGLCNEHRYVWMSNEEPTRAGYTNALLARSACLEEAGEPVAAAALRAVAENPS